MKFIIYTPHFNENIGGVIVLHELGATLQRLGQNVKLWNYTTPHPHEFSPVHNNSKLVEHFKLPIGLGLIDRDCPYGIPHATANDVNDSIVIYSDSVVGNPLGADKVIRWHLYYPAWKAEVMSIGKSDLLYFFLDKYIPPFINRKCAHLLSIHAIRHDLYFQPDPKVNKSGTAFIMHKGKDAAPIHHPHDAICLDGLRHIEVANIMRRVEMVISYDRDTAYNLYAILSGCDVIIAPNAHGLKQENSICSSLDSIIASATAEGMADITRARTFRDAAINAIMSLNEQNQVEVDRFLDHCSDFFFHGSPCADNSL